MLETTNLHSTFTIKIFSHTDQKHSRFRPDKSIVFQSIKNQTLSSKIAFQTKIFPNIAFLEYRIKVRVYKVRVIIKVVEEKLGSTGVSFRAVCIEEGMWKDHT